MKRLLFRRGSDNYKRLKLITKRYHGSCLCGEIHFSVSGFSDHVANCHCTMCRKFHGAAFGTLVQVSDLIWHKGSEYLQAYIGENGTTRTFCQKCGSSLGFHSKGAPPQAIEIAIATFDETLPVKVDAQIFSDNKANWCALHEDIPIYKQARLSD